MSKQFEYYGNHVFGEGESPPLTNQEPDNVYCPECWDKLESDNELIRYQPAFLNKTVLTCIKCKQYNDENL